jgi:hypothetical protein
MLGLIGEEGDRSFVVDVHDQDLEVLETAELHGRLERVRTCGRLDR